jgi:hypothetical protein
MRVIRLFKKVRSDSLGMGVNRSRLFEDLRTDLVKLIELHIDLIGEVKVVLLFFPERFKEVFLEDKSDLIVKTIRFF